MRLNYVRDISEKSYSFSNTPGTQARCLPFYVNGCGHFYANTAYLTEREGLDDYLLFYTLAGSGVLEYNGSRFSLEPMRAVLIHCMLPHRYKTASQEPWDFKFIHFSGSAARLYFDMINEGGLNAVLMDGKNNISECISSIISIIRHPGFHKDIRASLEINNILTRIVTTRSLPPNNTRYYQHTDDIEKVIGYIERNYTKDISTDLLAALIPISKYHFIRLFKEYMGLGLYEYVINYRVNISKILLRETNYSISEVCANSGFNDVNNYIRCFKKLVGTTPAHYRKHMILI